MQSLWLFCRERGIVRCRITELSSSQEQPLPADTGHCCFQGCSNLGLRCCMIKSRFLCRDCGSYALQLWDIPDVCRNFKKQPQLKCTHGTNNIRWSELQQINALVLVSHLTSWHSSFPSCGIRKELTEQKLSAILQLNTRTENCCIFLLLAGNAFKLCPTPFSWLPRKVTPKIQCLVSYMAMHVV